MMNPNEDKDSKTEVEETFFDAIEAETDLERSVPQAGKNGAKMIEEGVEAQTKETAVEVQEESETFTGETTGNKKNLENHSPPKKLLKKRKELAKNSGASPSKQIAKKAKESVDYSDDESFQFNPYKDNEDRKYLNSLTEKERENILYERFEKEKAEYDTKKALEYHLK